MVTEHQRLAPLRPLDGGPLVSHSSMLASANTRPGGMRPLSSSPATDSGCVAQQLRDGILQDLLAVSMLVEAVRRDLRVAAADGEGVNTHAADHVEALLERTALTLESDIETLRNVIDRIRLIA